MKRLLISVVLLLSLTSVCQAKKYQAVTGSGKEVTVHTNPVPVVVHRVLPPYGPGKHVYERGTSKAK